MFQGLYRPTFLYYTCIQFVITQIKTKLSFRTIDEIRTFLEGESEGKGDKASF